MLSSVKIKISQEEIIEAIKEMKKKERESFLEDLLAATSPEYLESVREARADYKAGRAKTHKEVFGK
jgi:PHD/YefM family antitoxin component YafN of YafNO toxin-antitoxin module